jgi:subtilisin family serine protease
MRSFEDQGDPTWGLDRLDESTLPLDDNYHYEYTGSGVKVFIVDTGIRSSHREFGGRVQCGYSIFRSGSCEDKQGHGTHVAGTVGGSIYGVAKNVDLVTVRVLDSSGNGSTSGVLAGIDYIRRQKQNNPGTPMVANMSLGGGSSAALDAAVDSVVAAGVVFAVAAGNADMNACFSSPASADNAITVGATNIRDIRSSFSNYGPCVDIFAPGEQITSAWASSVGAINTISGTSMAAPHVAGVAALYLEANPSWTPSQVWEAMKKDAIRGAVTRPGSGSPNLLVSTENISNGGDGEDNGSPTQPPDDNGDGGNIECSNFFRRCSRDTDCCSASCNFGICWFW